MYPYDFLQVFSHMFLCFLMIKSYSPTHMTVIHATVFKCKRIFWASTPGALPPVRHPLVQEVLRMGMDSAFRKYPMLEKWIDPNGDRYWGA